MASRNGGRAAAFSTRLVEAHNDLRDRIAALRAGLGAEPPAAGTLAAHCLAFCSALTTHHRGEDEGLFARLVEDRPDLAGTVAKLVDDHTLIAGLLARAAGLAERAAAAEPEALPALGRELDGLASIMESHFGYEERALGAALDAGVPDTGWSAPVFRFEDGSGDGSGDG